MWRIYTCFIYGAAGSEGTWIFWDAFRVCIRCAYMDLKSLLGKEREGLVPTCPRKFHWFSFGAALEYLESLNQPLVVAASFRLMLEHLQDTTIFGPAVEVGTPSRENSPWRNGTPTTEGVLTTSNKTSEYKTWGDVSKTSKNMKWYCWWFRNPKQPPLGCIQPYE